MDGDKGFFRYIRISENRYYPMNFIRTVAKRYYAENKLPSSPLQITWNITNRCNFNCSYCSNGLKKISNESDPIRIAKKIASLCPISVSILGGEPTIVPELIAAIKILCDSNIHVDLITNGIGINQSFIEGLREIKPGFLKVEISLDSTNPVVNDTNRAKGSFVAATNALENVAATGIPCRVQMTVTELNQNDIETMYRYCDDLGVDSFGFSTVADYGKGISDTGLNFDLIEKQCLNIIQKPGKTHFEKIRLSGSRKPIVSDPCLTLEDALRNEFLKCSGAKYKMHVEPDGKVYPCDYMVYPEYCMGDIEEDCWNSDAALNFRKIVRTTKEGCKTCTNYACNTGCYAQTYAHKLRTNVELPPCRIIHDLPSN